MEEDALAELSAEARTLGPRMRDWAQTWIDTRLAGRGFDARTQRLLFRRFLSRLDTDTELETRIAAIRELIGTAALGPALDALERETGPSLANAHTLFVYAWRAAPPEVRALVTLHPDEPELVIGARGTVRVAISVAGVVARYVPEDERPIFDELLAFARRKLDQPEAQLRDELYATRRLKSATSFAWVAVDETRYLKTNSTSTGSVARAALTRAMKLIGEREGADGARRLLDGLEAELRRCDVLHALEERGRVPTSPVLRAVWRGAGPDGTAALWCAALEDGRLGLFRKEGRRWQWTEGAADEILALVPDVHFADAARALRR